MNLFEALNPILPARIAIVGAGGKTTTAFQLARQVEGFAWVTTTTHLGTDQTALADLYCGLESVAGFKPGLYMKQKVTLLTGPFSADNRVHSPSVELLEMIHQASLRENVSLFVEADGSRSIPLKAPGDHEPPIPDWVTHVIVLAGLSVLGQPLSAQSVFRAERYAELTGLPIGAAVSIESIRDMLVHPLGGLKNIPAGAQRVVLFNQADDAWVQSRARAVVPDLLAGGFDRIIIGGLKSAPNSLESYTK